MSDPLTFQSIFRRYSVHFVDDAMKALGQRLKDQSFFLVDESLLKLYRSLFEGFLPVDRTMTIRASELNKSLDQCQEILKTLVDKNIRRNHALVAIGGGILQDITAFSASILYRGIEWHFIPTTLLAQADSCIGSKTSINLGGFKNLLGNFYPPSSIMIDVKFLKSLTPGDIQSGIGEILHYFLIDDSPMTGPLMERYEELISEPLGLLPFIRQSLNIKKEVIERDEFDRSERNLFNYGHTFGHALESLTNYEINHGQAVTLGMDLANFISVEFGYMDNKTFDEVHQILEKNIPPFNADKYDLGKYFTALSMDKKNVGNYLGCILSRKPGEMFKTQIAIDERLKSLLTAYLQSVKGIYISLCQRKEMTF